MKSSEIREKFLEFFKGKDHEIVPSAPIVLKDDPTLMFTNAGMNQFKDFFLGNRTAKQTRVTDTQKCLRVSGKHNDLEEVGVDTYHHTMFEMLGNWSFGDYFKEKAIEWAWELLTEVYKIPIDRLYITIFEGDKKDGLEADNESREIWKKYVSEDRILLFDRKDNFWEMGSTGPCGPCSEIHIDLRDNANGDAHDLVNTDHPEIIEIWNLVFIEFNRKSDGSLEQLPQKHVDTGMGFERLTMALQRKQSSYDTDIFERSIEFVNGRIVDTKDYSKDQQAIAKRVIVDHIRAIVFAISDGQIPANTGAGYVIRRILRRAVRYGYTYLGINTPFLHDLSEVVVDQYKSVFSNVLDQAEFIKKVIFEEEASFLRTLGNGLKRFEEASKKSKGKKVFSGEVAFELYDTYGFPIDLTRLIASEQGMEIDEAAFESALEQQKARSKADAAQEQSDWNVVNEGEDSVFLGYDSLKSDVRIQRYRKVNIKGKQIFHVVLNQTPFYPEGGGQVGDKGSLTGSESHPIVNTFRENDVIVHVMPKLPDSVEGNFVAQVDVTKRHNTARNHTATHLLHKVLRDQLGEHVEQRGSLVNADYLRFDFSHFQKVSDEELATIESTVNEMVISNIPLQEHRSIAFDTAKEMGAMALFGEKYGDKVRVIQFDNSLELCGGTHVQATGEIGLFKIVSEGSSAAGIRRIEAISGAAALERVNTMEGQLETLNGLLKSQGDPIKAVKHLLEENSKLKKEQEAMVNAQAAQLKDSLKSKAKSIGEVQFISSHVPITDGGAIKNLAMGLAKEESNCFVALTSSTGQKAVITLAISKDLSDSRNLHAGNIVRDLAAKIGGGGGGQPTFATAGGSKQEGLEDVLKAAEELVTNLD